MDVQTPPQQEDIPLARRSLFLLRNAVDALQLDSELGVEPFFAFPQRTQCSHVVLNLARPPDLIVEAIIDVVRGVLRHEGRVMAGFDVVQSCFLFGSVFFNTHGLLFGVHL